MNQKILALNARIRIRLVKSIVVNSAKSFRLLLLNVQLFSGFLSHLMRYLHYACLWLSYLVPLACCVFLLLILHISCEKAASKIALESSLLDAFWRLEIVCLVCPTSKASSFSSRTDAEFSWISRLGCEMENLFFIFYPSTRKPFYLLWRACCIDGWYWHHLRPVFLEMMKTFPLFICCRPCVSVM